MTSLPPSVMSPVQRIALVIVVVTLIAYSNSFSAPFLFDDAGAIFENPTLHHFLSAFTPLPNGTPVSGRPLVNLTFALNETISEGSVGTYHALNFVIHLLAALTLFGLVRRTLLLTVLSLRFRDHALEIAGATAMLWAVHPLQTESVTYLSQRAESLMGLFYLLTLYCFVRAVTLESRSWLILSATACLAGMASKEVMISAPLLVLLYDRIFVARTFSAALRTRTLYYAALAATWFFLAWQMFLVGDRGSAVGTGLKINAWHYALTQIHAITLYLALTFWPHPLIFDYGTTVVSSLHDVIPEAILLVILITLALFFIWKNSPLGFVGAWFFAILAPSSSIVPLVKQTIAEHRMYLPLAAIILLSVLVIYYVAGRFSRVIFSVLVLAGILLTWHRNNEYLDGLTIWRESLDYYPENPRAHINLGNAYVQAGDPQQGAAEFKSAIRLDPTLPEAHNNLGVVDAGGGDYANAILEYREALRLSPGWDKPQQNLNRLTTAPKIPPAK